MENDIVAKDSAKSSPNKIKENFSGKYPEDVFDILEKVPEDARQEVMQSISLFASMTKTNPEAEILKKLTDANIDHFIDTADKQHEREMNDRKGNRQFIIWIFFGSCALVVVTMLLLRDSQPSLMEKIITILLTFAAGFGGGYGLGNHKRDD